MPKILVLNGPNLNLLGRREPGIYGSETLEEIEARLQQTALTASASLEFRQFNAEHEMIECLAGTLWEAQRDGTPPDEAVYLECLRRLPAATLK